VSEVVSNTETSASPSIKLSSVAPLLCPSFPWFRWPSRTDNVSSGARDIMAGSKEYLRPASHASVPVTGLSNEMYDDF